MDDFTKKILQTIIKHCNVIDETKIHFGSDYVDFENNAIYQNALLTPVVQIGELVKRFSDIFKEKYNEIPLRNIAGMRDVLIHRYETIDKVILWNVATDEIPKIKDFCIDLLRKED